MIKAEVLIETKNWNEIIKNPKNRYLADPFLWEHNNQTICFVEDFSYITNKGSISAIEIREDENQILGPVLNKSHHLSYPFIFEFENNLYMCPESCEKQSIDLYVCEEFPLKWIFKKNFIFKFLKWGFNCF